jgi:clan AA aspartic protease
MIINGRIDEKNQLWIDVTVEGLSNKQDIPVLIDTGFTGELQLPLSIAVPLGLRLDAVGKSEYADGRVSGEMFFSGAISWGTTKRDVTIIVSDSDTALLGGGLLHGYLMVVDFEKKQLIIKEPGFDEPQPPETEVNPVIKEDK